MQFDDRAQESSEIDKLKQRVAELQQKKEQLQKSEEMYRLLAENSVDAIWRLDDQFQVHLSVSGH